MIVMRELPEGVFDRFSLSTMALAWLAMASAAWRAVSLLFLAAALEAGVDAGEGGALKVTAETGA